MRLSGRSLILAVLVILLAGCGTGGSGTNLTRQGIPPSAPAVATTVSDDVVTSTTAQVSAKLGSTLTLPDGAQLLIPPGALPYDATITFSTPTHPDVDSLTNYYQVEPSMTLLKPATLVLPFQDDNPMVNDDQITVASSSVTLPTRDSSGELSNWADESDGVTDIDCTNHTVTVQLSHFSLNMIWARVNEPAYLVVSVPARYMRPGDILICLTGGAIAGTGEGHYNWFTGHAGLFCGANRPELAGKVVVDGHGATVDSNPDVVESVGRGVSPGSVATFRPGFERDHIDLGPRRAPSSAPTETAVSFALAQLGKPYNLIGDGGVLLRELMRINGVTFIPGFNPNGYSCSGLVDAAYLRAGTPLATIPDRLAGAVTPRDIFLGTVPATDMTAKVGEMVQIPVIGVVTDPESAGTWFPGGGTTLKGWYTDQRRKTYSGVTSSYTITASGLPAGATFTPQGNGVGYLLSWTPSTAGSTTITFTLNPDSKAGFKMPWGSNVPVNVKNGTRAISQNLTINVTP